MIRSYPFIHLYDKAFQEMRMKYENMIAAENTEEDKNIIRKFYLFQHKNLFSSFESFIAAEEAIAIDNIEEGIALLKNALEKMETTIDTSELESKISALMFELDK